MTDPLPWKDRPYSIKRFGTSITNCDSEPVHTPGCVQAHGVVVVMRLGDLQVLQISENTQAVLGEPPEAYLQQTVARVLGAELTDRLRGMVERDPLQSNPMLVGQVQREPASLQVTAHTIDDAVVVELEPVLPHAPVIDHSRLLRLGLGRLAEGGSLADVADRVAAEFAELTGMDRVMVYRFHPDMHGEVIAERRGEGIPSFLGLHYPASDIPEPARRIFMQLWSRPVPDIGGPLAELVPLVRPDTQQPLNMTYCALRGPSVMYTEYLQNMGVSAALTMSLRVRGKLWGMVACHHHGGPHPVPHEVRAACEFLAQASSIQIAGAITQQGLSRRLAIETTQNEAVRRSAASGDIEDLLHDPEALLGTMGASGVAITHESGWLRAGSVPESQVLDELSTWLQEHPGFTDAVEPQLVTSELSSVYPHAARLQGCAAGLIAMPLERWSGSMILWFRPEARSTIHWAGDPGDKPMVTGPNGPRLTPRASFQSFVQSTEGQCRPWEPMVVDAAARFRLHVMELVVARSRRLEALNRELRASNDELDAFAFITSHDLKEPLRGIHKHAVLIQAALEEGSELRAGTERIAWLAERMDGLLDALLHYSRVGQRELGIVEVDTVAIAREAVEMVGGRVEEGMQIDIAEDLPALRGDRARLREVLVNLLSNAIKYGGGHPIRVYAPSTAEVHQTASADPGDHAVLAVQDQGIGIEGRDFDRIFDLFRRLHPREAFGGGNGVGLAIVERIVHRHEGQVWLTSVVGEGTTFYFSAPRA